MSASLSQSPAPASTSADKAREPSVREELRALTHLATPIVFAQVALLSMGLVDVAVVGHTSVQDLAGVALGRTLGFVSMTIGIGVSMALEPLAAQALGAGEKERAWCSFVQTLHAIGLVWIVSAVVALISTKMLVPFGVQPDVASRATAFLTAQLPGLGLYLVFQGAKTFLQAHGHTRPAAVATVLASAINFLVCNLLVRGDAALIAVHLPPIGLPPLGATGAGLAFSIATVTLVALTGLAAWRLRPQAITKRTNEDRAPMPRVRDVLRLGLPIGAQMFAEAGVFSLAAILAGRLGERVVSAHQIAIALASTTYMAAVGVSGATAVRVGRAVGEGRSPARAGYVGIVLGMAWMSCCALLFAFAPRILVALFTTDTEVGDLGVVLLRIAAVFQLFDGLQAVTMGALRGAGDVRAPFVIVSITYWLLGMPAAIFFAFSLHGGAPGLWWGLTLSLVIVSLLLFVRFVRVASREVVRI